MKVKYLNLFTLIVFMLVSTSVFSKDEIDITKAKNFKQNVGIYAGGLENIAFSILLDNQEFIKGKDVKFKYDFKNPEYKKLLEEYKIKDIAGKGSSFEKLARVMDYFAHRLIHGSNFGTKDILDKYFKGKEFKNLTAYELLKYSLDNKEHGINCRAKSEILKEIGLALGIYIRKVRIYPVSVNVDKVTDCHVVNELWDESLNKWVMLDMTSNIYWTDSKGTPLSILEIRDKLIKEEEGLKGVFGPYNTNMMKSSYPDPKQYELENEANQFFLKVYFSKNLYLIHYEEKSSVGESWRYYLVPTKSSYKNKVSKSLISRASVEASPIGK